MVPQPDPPHPLSGQIDNPLRILCRQLGVHAETLAARAGVSAAEARAACSAEPPAAVSAYVRLVDALRVEWKLLAAPRPVEFVVEVGAFDDRYDDDAFRRARALLPLPRTRGELRALVADLCRRNTYAGVVSILQGSYVPTAQGLRSWRRSTVGQHLKFGEDTDDPTPLVAGEEVRVAWRRYCVQVLLAELWPPDPAAAVRYAVRFSLAGDYAAFRSTRPMPKCAAEGILATLAGTPWVAGRWREGRPPGAAGPAAASGSG